MALEVAACVLLATLLLLGVAAGTAWWLVRRGALGQPSLPRSPRKTEHDASGPTDLVPPDPAEPAPREDLVVAPGPTTRYPLLFAHGFMGFDEIGVSRLRREYFRGVRTKLEALGYEVHVARVAPAGAIRKRAAQLAEQIERVRAPRVNIIAHSMGGLDARYAIAHFGLADRVASLVTVGTPHRGTPLADTALRFGELRRVRKVLDRVGASIDGLFELSPRQMEEFNRGVPDAEGVLYASVVGALSRRRRGHALLTPGYTYLRRTVGPNDGMVPADSQRWGEVLDEVDADHWAQIGWSGGFDVVTFYVALAEHLARRGL